MYIAILVIQFAIVITSFFFVWTIAMQKNTALTRATLVIAFMALIMNVGNALELTSKSVEACMVANCFKYMGAVFIATAVLYFCIKYTGAKIPGYWLFPFFVWDPMVLFLVWTNDTHHLIFKELVYINDPSFSYTEKIKGPVYTLYILTTLLQLTASLLVVLYCILTTKNVRLKRNCYKILVGVAMPFLGLIITGTHMVTGFDILPVSVALGLFVIFIAIMTQKDFLVSSIAHDRILQNITEPIIIFDSDLTMVEANEAAVKLLPIQDVLDGKKEMEIDYVQKCIEKGYINFDSAKYSFEIRADKIYDGKKILGYSLMYVDMTAEKEKLRQMEYLKNEADRANRVKSEFLANMSHEIRTPLNAIVGMNDMILRDSKEDLIKEYAVDVKKSSDILLGLINDILDSAKISTGNLTILPVEYNLYQLVNNLYSMMLPKAEEKNLKFTCKVDDSMPCLLKGDDVRVRQIIMNLVSNAIKYTQDGEINLNITARREGKEVVVDCRVKDTGIGIRQEDLQKVLGRFERVDDAKTRYIEGTGLGLSITMQLLKLMDSDLELESEYGVGSTFGFQLRQTIVDGTPVSKKKDADPDVENAKRYLDFTAKEARILVVDDNKINLKVFEYMLKPLQAQIVSVESGEKTLEVTKETVFDIIFMDHMMPEMDGIETKNALMEDESNLNRETPMVMLSANAIAGAREAYLADGFSDYLAKPIEVAALHEILLQFLPEEKVVKNKED